MLRSVPALFRSNSSPLTIAIIAGFLANVPVGRGQDEEDDEYRRGLVATYSDGDGQEFVRVDRSVVFAGGDRLVGERLTGPVSEVVWRGYLMSQASGTYRLSAYVAGNVTVKLNDELVVRGSTNSPSWVDSQPIELSFDWHPIEVRFRYKSETPHLALYWSGPKFQLEPISTRQFYHDPEKSPDDSFERGALLAQALRCAACHENDSTVGAANAPDLSKVAGNLNADWVANWLSAGDAKNHKGRRMPSFGFDSREAEALTAYLFSKSDPASKRRPPKGDVKKGERLFLTLGCLACHQQGELGESDLFGGGDLTEVAKKRPAEFFEPWLRAPAEINSHHRMPVFDLSDKERGGLAKYLATFGDPSPRSAAKKQIDLVQLGSELFQKNGCANCHQRQGAADEPRTRASRLNTSSGWKNSCAKVANRSKQQPSYHRSEADHQALQNYLVTAKGPNVKEAQHGQSILTENNCLACHSRDGAKGIGPQLPKLAKKHPDLTAEIPAMAPPSLTSVGDKLHDEAIVEALNRKIGTRRPWLHIRMPKFNLTEDEMAAVVQHLVRTDRIPDRPPEKQLNLSNAMMQVHGSQLVTSGGFGCTSCHQVGKSIPPKAPLNAKGPDLSMLGKRIRREWFDRFVPNPARIVPRMEMPSIQLAVGRVLDENIDNQLAAVWHVLNQPDFHPPRPDAVRIVRRNGESKSTERAAVLTDVIRTPDTRYIKPLLIGLPNRHNVLFDLASGGFAGWHIGDVAHQQTEGKTWYWETAGTSLMNGLASESEINIKHSEYTESPQVFEQFVTEADDWSHTKGGGLSFQYRLHYGQLSTQAVSVRQTFEPIGGIGADGASGFRRRIQITNLRAGSTVRFRIVSDSFTVKRSSDRRILIVNDNPATFVRVREPASAQFDVWGMVSAKENRGSAEIAVDYLSNLQVTGPLVKASSPSATEILKLNVAPGYEATRLPLDGQLTPIGLGWKPDGTLITSTLKGNVWLARDTNDDGLEDESQRFSDELASPYGVAGYEDYIDVVTKYALLRLYDKDKDGRAERTETLASGWGHTADYHDWVVGLPQDQHGNYYVALPCQQDQRSLAATKYRGTVLRVGPREPTDVDPRRFHVEQLSGGHRFPMGIALNQLGEIFVTDNQGNYNPFNELNHVMKDARYGFINAFERTPDFKPPLTPPAIDIPHPWTRSVNGICFLHSSGSRSGFGPFEGHLIGCEYDTRRLIRMSLQRVGNTYQGAAYPFSYDSPREGPPLLGPIVCAVAPDGDLYVGNIRESGWGGGNNIGSIVRLKPQGRLPAGIAEVTAKKTGFVIHFTRPVDRKRAADVKNYSLQSVTRDSTPSYGGPDRDRRVEKIAAIHVADDGLSATVSLDELREDFVYEFRLKNLTGDEEFFPAEAYYTLRKIPLSRTR